MQVIGISLLALRLPGSPALNLGGVSLAQAIAFGLFSLGGGIITDRSTPRRVLLFTQPLGLLLALGFGIILAHYPPSLPSLIGFAFLSAVVASVDGPARAALLPTLVSDDLVMRAGAMLTLGVNLASTAGPLLAGWVAGHLGLPAVFFLNAASFTGVIFVLARHVKNQDTPHAPSGASVWAAVLEGLAVVRRDVLLRSALLSYGVLLVFGPSPSFILPLFGQKILGLHQGQLGALFAAVGVGTILGALGAVASRGDGQEGRFLTAGLTVWAAALGAFAWSGTLLWAVVALTILGAARSVVGTSATAILQRHAPEAQRGRVMSLNTLMLNGGRPIGDALLALLAAWLPLTLLVTGCAAAVGLTGWGVSRHLRPLAPAENAEDSSALPNQTE